MNGGGGGGGGKKPVAKSPAGNAISLGSITMNATVPGEKGLLKTDLDQLRQQAALQRKKVSEVAKELMAFCEKEKANDRLIGGPPQNNPFEEKKPCSML